MDVVKGWPQVLSNLRILFASSRDPLATVGSLDPIFMAVPARYKPHNIYKYYQGKVHHVKSCDFISQIRSLTGSLLHFQLMPSPSWICSSKKVTWPRSHTSLTCHQFRAGWSCEGEINFHIGRSSSSFPESILETFIAVTLCTESKSFTILTVLSSKSSEAGVTLSRRSKVLSTSITPRSSPAPVTFTAVLSSPPDQAAITKPNRSKIDITGIAINFFPSSGTTITRISSPTYGTNIALLSSPAPHTLVILSRRFKVRSTHVTVVPTPTSLTLDRSSFVMIEDLVSRLTGPYFCLVQRTTLLRYLFVNHSHSNTLQIEHLSFSNFEFKIRLNWLRPFSSKSETGLCPNSQTSEEQFVSLKVNFSWRHKKVFSSLQSCLTGSTTILPIKRNEQEIGKKWQRMLETRQLWYTDGTWRSFIINADPIDCSSFF